MSADDAALLRIRVLRSASYRCQYRPRPGARPCGAFASLVGTHPADDAVVALCLEHALE